MLSFCCMQGLGRGGRAGEWGGVKETVPAPRTWAFLSPQLPVKAFHDVPAALLASFPPPLPQGAAGFQASKPLPTLPCSKTPFLLSCPSRHLLTSGDSVKALPPLGSPPCSPSLESRHREETCPTSLSSAGAPRPWERLRIFPCPGPP